MRVAQSLGITSDELQQMLQAEHAARGENEQQQSLRMSIAELVHICHRPDSVAGKPKRARKRLLEIQELVERALNTLSVPPIRKQEQQ